nr:retrotransposon protein, putative, Ty1-copia subclass [Tanacetum cinerariifolium]
MFFDQPRPPDKAKYALEILKKYGMEKGQSIGTPMATKPKLDADLSGNPDSSFELTAFLDADHAGCIDTRKSTYRGTQFLGDKSVSWISEKQDCTAMSSAEAEYMALSTSCAQMSVHGYTDDDEFVPDMPTLISKLDINDPSHFHPNDSAALTIISVKLK